MTWPWATRLLADAGQFDPGALRRLGQHLHTVLDPDGPADIEEAENHAWDSRELWIQQSDNGQVRLRGTLDTGALITPRTVRRLACDAQILAAVLGARSEVIDIARLTRVVPAATRRALVLRDQHCRRPGCHRPPSQCHAHHLRHWADGGPTDRDNLVLLCDYHHREIHNDGWTLTPKPGQPPQFHPPDWARQP